MTHNKWLILIFWLISIVVFSQDKATFSFDNVLLSECLFSIEKTYNIRFSYSDDLIKNEHVTLVKEERTLFELLAEIENQSIINFVKISERYYILKYKKQLLNTTQELEEIIIKNYLTKGITKKRQGFFVITPNQLDILPGLIEADIIESIQQLPGVSSLSETATGLAVRGGTSDQNRVMWDGINIYHGGHLFGMISAFNPNVSKKITFYNKGTNPRYGERVSSVINIETDDSVTKQLKTSYSINGTNSDFVIDVPLLKNKLSTQFSVRKSYVNTIQTVTFKRLANKVFQNTKFQNYDDTDFFFKDYNVKINYHLNDHNKMAVSIINIENQLDNTITDADNVTTNDKLDIKNTGYAFHWQKIWTTKVSQKTTFSLSKYYLDYNIIKSNEGQQISKFDKNNVVFDTNINTEIRIQSNHQNHLYIGYQYAFNDVDYAFKNTQKLELVLDTDKKRLGIHALFSNYRIKNFRLFDIDAGFRANYYEQFNVIKFEPRLILSKRITNYLKAQITGEVKNQVISQIDETVLSDLSLENRLWHLSDNKIFPIINSKQITAGLLYKNTGWSLDLDNYYKKITGVTALSLGFLNPDGKTFRIGTKTIHGIDLYIKKELNKFQIWSSYSYTNVRSQFNDLNNNKSFKSNTNITHAFSTSLSYKLKGLQVAAEWKWHTGKPYTKSFYKDDVLYFDGINTGKLPNYSRLNFSSTYQFNLSKSHNIKGKLGVSIRNVLNQQRVFSKEYHGFNNINDPVVIVDKLPLGFTPNFLFKVYF